MGRTSRKSPIPTLRSQLIQMKELLPQPKVETGRHKRAIRPPAPGINSGVRGTPAIYDPIRFPHMANILCKEYGFTNAQMAKVFGVSVKTVNMWMTTHEEFKIAARAGRDEFDTVKVENALLKIALGYEFEETTTKATYVMGKDKEGKDVKVPAREVSTTIKQVAPNAKAIQFWLTNRQAERWRNVTNVTASITSKTEHTQRTVQVTADMSTMNSDQLRALRDLITSQKTNNPIEIEQGSGTMLLDLVDKAHDVLDEGEYAEYLE